MDECEVCGNKKASKVAIIEGVKLNVCSDCARLGKVIEKPAVALPKKTPQSSGSRKNEYELSKEEIVEDYAEILRRQISKIGISYGQLAKSIDENESYLKRVVHGDTLPTLKLAKKLEKALNVKITEVPE